MAAGYVPTSPINTLLSNTTAGTVASPDAIDGAIVALQQAINDNYDFATGLISAGTLSNLGIVNVKDYKASGSEQTTTGSITAGTATLTAASAIDFAVGQGINVYGKYEVASLQVTAAATVSSNVTVTLNGVAFTVAVLNGDTAIGVATKIRAATFTGWTTGGTAGTDTVTFTSTTTGTKTDATYSAGTTGATGTMSTTTQGTADLITTIIGISGTTITLAANAITTVTSVTVKHDDYAALNTLFNTTLSGIESTVYVPTGTYYITTNLTIPSNIKLVFLKNAMLSPATGIAVTINGPIEAGMYQIFTGSGTIVGSMKVDVVYPQWWGAKSDGTDDINAINAAVDVVSAAGGGIVFYPEGTYGVSTPIKFRSNVLHVGSGMGSTIIKALANSNIFGEATPVAAYSYCGISDLAIDGNSAALTFPADDADGNSIRLNQISYGLFRNVRIYNSIFNAVSIYNSSNDNRFENFFINDVGKSGTLPPVYTFNGFFIEFGSNRNKIINPRINVTRQYGIWIGARDADNYDNEIINPWIASTTGDGIRIGDDATANVCYRAKVINPTILSAGDIGIRAYHAGTGSVTDLEINGGIVQDATNRGILLDTRTTRPKLIGTKIRNCGAYGLTISGTDSFIDAVKVSGSTTTDITDTGTNTQLIGTNLVDGRYGTFVPTVLTGGASVGRTYTSQSGTYRVNGNRVYFDLTVELSAVGSSTGVLSIGGLTFASVSSGPFAVVSIATSSVTFTNIPMGLVLNNATQINIYNMASGAGTTQLTETSLAANSVFYISGSYRIT